MGPQAGVAAKIISFIPRWTATVEKQAEIGSDF
jgi:hypothetical protein